jgi:uncharacterized protein YecT (DUF1311 family)
MRFVAAVLLSFSSCALAQGSAAVETCRAYARQELKRDEVRAKDVVIERDASLTLERYGRKLGTQPVSSVLTGYGTVVYENAPSTALAFVCLLADEKRAVFFQWMPRENAPALGQCRRSSEPRGCLEALLGMAEADLTQFYALRFQEARERDSKGQDERSVLAYRKSNEEWLQYRDAECARQRDLAPQGASAQDFELACRVDLTRRRAIDMR